MADYPPSDDRLRHLIAQEINPHVASWKLAFFIADGIVTSRSVRGELKRIAEAHAAGEHCGDRNCEHCWTASVAAEAQQQPDTETPAYDRTAWEAYRRDAGCAYTSPDPSTCAVSHRSGPWLCVCHRLSAELTEEERAALFPERQFDRPESTWAAPRTATGARLTAERRESAPHEPDGPEEPSGAR